MSPASHVAVSGCSFTTMALRKPACSKAMFQASAPSRMVGRSSTGVVFSIHQTMGSTGSLIAADGSFLRRSQRWITSRQGMVSVVVMSSFWVMK